MAREVDRRCRSLDAVIEDGKEHSVGATARPAVDTDAVMVDVLAVIPHIIEQDLSVESLDDVGAVGAMTVLAVFLLTLSPSVEVEIDAHGTHPCERSQSQLLVFAIATTGKMAVRTDDKRIFSGTVGRAPAPLCGLVGMGRVDGSEEMLAGKGLDADILGGISVAHKDLSQYRSGMDETALVVVNAQQMAHLKAHTVATNLKLLAV